MTDNTTAKGHWLRKHKKNCECKLNAADFLTAPGPVTTRPATVLETARELTEGERQKDYGPPEVNLGRTAKLWSALLGFDVTAEQVVMCMILAKVARESHLPKRDNRVDIAGYANVLDMLVRTREAAF